MTDHPQSHTFKSSWRWTESFESFVRNVIDGYTANICAGLSPVGDVRVDMASPVELVAAMKADGQSLDVVRDTVTGVLRDDFYGQDVVADLYHADDPAVHPAADALDTDGFVRADVFTDSRLPFADDTFDWVVSDPPWKDVTVEQRKHLLDELTRITTPGGGILFNGWWNPTNELVTQVDVRLRQDNDRYAAGTPNVSYVGIYRVHSSKHVARYHSRRPTDLEYAPTPSSTREQIEAELGYLYEVRGSFTPGEYDMDAVGPNPSKHCPNCSCTRLSVATEDAGYETRGGTLYVCEDCGFPASESELEQVAEGEPGQMSLTHDLTSAP